MTKCCPDAGPLLYIHIQHKDMETSKETLNTTSSLLQQLPAHLCHGREQSTPLCSRLHLAVDVGGGDPAGEVAGGGGKESYPGESWTDSPDGVNDLFLSLL